MKTLMIILLMLGTSALMVPTTSTQETSTNFFCGIVLGVDATTRLLSIEEASLDGDKMTFTVAADADLRKQSAPIELGEIRVGDPVSVEYEETAKGAVALSVKVITSPESD